MFMAGRLMESPCRKFKTARSSDVQLYARGFPFSLKRELLAEKSKRLALSIKENPRVDISHVLKDGLADSETFEQVARFCHGFDVQLSIENVIHVACLAHYLGMTEDHCKNNLLAKAVDFFESQVLSSWNNSIRAIKSAENILRQAVDLGLVGACVETIIAEALKHPNLLGEPVRIPASNADDDEEENGNLFRANVKRKLFVLDWNSEDLSMLSISLFEPVMSEMNKRGVPVEYVCAAVCQYAKRWVFSSMKEGDDVQGYNYRRNNNQREIIEAVERMLPDGKGLLPCASLSEMLKSAIVLDASEECKNGFEIRIGKQLDEAAVEDLLIPSQGYAKEEKYDIECVKRILKSFYHNYTSQNVSELITVAELVDNFLLEIASDIDLKMHTFVSVAELSSAASEGIQRCSDGIYRAVDVYFDKHKYLTDSEREEICRVLDCNKMSPEACHHAAQNQRFPIRIVVQVLFVTQLQLRDTIPKEDKGLNEKLLLKYYAEEGEEEELEMKASNGNGEAEEEDEVRIEMEKMGNKVLELERECELMRREIRNNGGGGSREAKKGKVSMWKEMKRKFGCMTMTSIQDCDSHVKKRKKVHPK
ncbi:OLC1v1006374C1 [Oldenlandia corymbosa var. corymbosa]|uniref:OLC1v1006374C1 n=1 Tax=Oldenlandia corymbosa var. corymbosa TaxID=529605 RepID=A0AAV1DGT9_OLDCO|nr:OLC1v1006374C1 [Oldenlandia corymbosa var. corymbosa]